MVDLHIHSTYSDGTENIDEIISHIKNQNFSHVALTDHDTINGTEEFSKKCKKIGVTAINGCEISIDFSPGRFHMLAYYIPTQNSAFNNMIEESRLSRLEYADNVIKIFKEKNIDIKLEDIKKFTANNTIISKNHIAKTLVTHGYASNIDEAFKKYLNKEGIAYIAKRKVTATEAIKIVSECGGLTFIAHPYSLKINDYELEQLVSSLAKQGLSGIECYTTYSDRSGIYKDISKERSDFYIYLANKYNLFISGGSDYHAKAKPGVEIGTGAGDLNINPNFIYKWLRN